MFTFDDRLFTALTLIAIGLSVPPLFRIASFIKSNRRTRLGLCPQCGYARLGVRAMCPECGSCPRIARPHHRTKCLFMLCRMTLLLLVASCAALAAIWPARLLIAAAPNAIIISLLPPTVPPTSKFGRDLMAHVTGTMDLSAADGETVCDWAASVICTTGDPQLARTAMEVLVSLHVDIGANNAYFAIDDLPRWAAMVHGGYGPSFPDVRTLIAHAKAPTATSVALSVLYRLRMHDLPAIDHYGPIILASITSNPDDVARSIVNDIATGRYKAILFHGTSSRLWTPTLVALASSSQPLTVRIAALDIFRYSADYSDVTNIAILYELLLDKETDIFYGAYSELAAIDVQYIDGAIQVGRRMMCNATDIDHRQRIERIVNLLILRRENGQ